MTQPAPRLAHFRPLLIAVAALLATGCGRDEFQHGTVSGTVTYGGKPVPSGDIVFAPAGNSKGTASKGTIVDGRYAIDQPGPIVGPHRVEIYAYRATGKKVPDLSREGIKHPRMIDEQVLYIPARYNNESELNKDIQPGPNEANFDLKAAGR